MNIELIRQKIHYHSVERGKIPGIIGGIKAYNTIMELANNSEIDLSVNSTFQEAFSNFYRLDFKVALAQKNTVFHRFFEVFQRYKINKETNVNTDIGDIFLGLVRDLKSVAGRNEYSFASKILHTLYPSKFSIYDSKVGKDHFGISFKNEKSFLGHGHTVEEFYDVIKNTYEMYDKMFKKFVSTNEGQEIVEIFNSEFSELPLENINNLKKIDFVLWIDRSDPQTLPKDEILALSL